MPSPSEAPRVTVVYPCLNEEEAIGVSVDRAREVLTEAGISHEVLVVDNASTDRSAEIARERGARVVEEPRRGYGSAYLRGLAEAKGDYLILLDADGTYPTELMPEFVRLLDEGADFVIGDRFAGLMEKDAMPFLNRHVGNPILSGLTRVLFRVPVRDLHCGMRGLKRSILPQLGLQTPGMEFATEMVVKALDADVKMEQVGIPYRPRIGDSKLNPLRDAWRHVEYMLVFAPAATLLWPGLLLLVAGLAVQLALLGGPVTFLRTWDVHTSLAGLTASLIGATLLQLGAVGTAWSASIGLRFRHSALARWISRSGDGPFRWTGLALALAGGALWASVIWRWAASGGGALAAVGQLSLATSLLGGGLALLVGAFLMHAIRLAR